MPTQTRCRLPLPARDCIITAAEGISGRSRPAQPIRPVAGCRSRTFVLTWRVANTSVKTMFAGCWAKPNPRAAESRAKRLGFWPRLKPPAHPAVRLEPLQAASASIAPLRRGDAAAQRQNLIDPKAPNPISGGPCLHAFLPPHLIRPHPRDRPAGPGHQRCGGTLPGASMAIPSGLGSLCDARFRPAPRPPPEPMKRPRPGCRDPKAWLLLQHGLFSFAAPRSRATTALDQAGGGRRKSFLTQAERRHPAGAVPSRPTPRRRLLPRVAWLLHRAAGPEAGTRPLAS